MPFSVFMPDKSLPGCENTTAKPVLGVRGTDPRLGQVVKDGVADADPTGVGNRQYEKSAPAVKAMLDRANFLHNPSDDPAQRPIVGGHSKGGAQAQAVIADNPNLVSEGVTFNSPGVDRRRAETHNRDHGLRAPADAQIPVTHYENASDVVETAGYQHLDGRIVESRKGAGTVGAHTTHMLDNLSSTDLQGRTTHPALATGGIMEQARSTIGNLLDTTLGLPVSAYESARQWYADNPSFERDSGTAAEERGTDVMLRDSAHDTVDSANAETVLESTPDGSTRTELDKGLNKRHVDADLRDTAAQAVEPTALNDGGNAGRVVIEGNADKAIESRSKARFEENHSPKAHRVAGALDSAKGVVRGLWPF